MANENFKLITALTTVPGSTVNNEFDNKSSSIISMIKSELKNMQSKLSFFNDSTELIIGGIVSSITGTMLLYLYKFLRNNCQCKVG